MIYQLIIWFHCAHLNKLSFHHSHSVTLSMNNNSTLGNFGVRDCTEEANQRRKWNLDRRTNWHIDSDLRGLVETERKRETFERNFNTEPGCELHGKDFADMNDLLQEALNT